MTSDMGQTETFLSTFGAAFDFHANILYAKYLGALTVPSSDRTLMQLTMLLNQTARTYKAGADKLAAAYGLSQAASWPVIMLGRLGPRVRPGVLADAIGLEPSSLVRLIDQLVDAGLVQRDEDETDRRARALSLTAEGRKRAAELEQALVPFRRTLFRNIPEDDVAACIRVLESLRLAVLDKQP